MADADDAPVNVDPFWQWAPGERRAATRPWLNALYLRDFQPRVGRDLAEAVDVAPLWDLVSHEFAHGMMGRTAVGQLLHNLFYAVYLLLFELDGDRRLRLPSWRLDGDDQLAAIVWRLRSLLLDLERSAGFVDEAFCTLLTVVIRRGLLLTEQMPTDVYERGINHIKRVSDPGVWLLCDVFSGSATSPGMPWFAADTSVDLARVKILLNDIAQFALNPPPGALREWWRTGRVSPPEDPWTRFAKALNHTKDAPSIDEASLRLAKISEHVLANKVGKSPSLDTLMAVMDTLFEQYRRDDPDPYTDIASALGLDAEAARTMHPVGGALRYLTRAHPTRQRDPLKQVFSEQAIMPVITRENDEFRCDFEVRMPLGPAVRFATAPDMQQRLLRLYPPGRNFASFGRMTVLPASPEIRLLWQLDLAATDLLTTGHLRCGCGTDCRPEQPCSCTTLLARIHRHIESDEGQPLPAPACIAR